MPRPKTKPAAPKRIDPEIVERLAVAMVAVDRRCRKTTDEHKALSLYAALPAEVQRRWFRFAWKVLERLQREGCALEQG